MKKVSIMILLLLGIMQAVAAEKDMKPDNIKTRIQAAFPELVIDKVEISPVSGLYQLTAGPVVLYVSNDGRYLLAGDVLDMEQRLEDRNLTEATRRQLRRSLLDHLSSKEMIIYHPKETKGSVTVFVDTDCGYCRKLHAEVPKLVEQGIEVRYLAFPRAGIGSSVYNKMLSAWCAKDPGIVMTKVMTGEAIETLTCNNTLESQLLLGRKLGISGTPTLVFADGTLWGGYLPAEKLASEAIKHNGRQ
jgi:thiol:disulfide interchange protein DsbC